jgi:hypothetical protein
VISRSQSAPQYALVDPTGTVVSFVTAAPGVDLKPFEGQRIAIQGARRYVPQLQRAHVMAYRVTSLEGVQRR